MARGRKTGGRKAGTPNRKTQEAQEIIRALGCDPFEGMARIAMDTQNPPSLRGKMYAELARYIYPKCRAVENSGPDDGGRIVLNVMSILDKPE